MQSRVPLIHDLTSRMVVEVRATPEPAQVDRLQRIDLDDFHVGGNDEPNGIANGLRQPARREDRNVRQLAGHVRPEIAGQIRHHEVAKCAEVRSEQCEGLVDLEARRVVRGGHDPRRVTVGREERRVDVELAVEHVQLGVLEVEQGVVVSHDGGRGPGHEYILETCEMCRTSLRKDQQET